MTSTPNPVRRLHDFGQAPWLDYIDRAFLEDGGLARAVEEDGVTGVTSNPTLFAQALARGERYDGQLAELLVQNPVAPAVELYERLAITDIRHAADVLHPVFESSEGRDGFVSLEVSPHLAHDTAGTVEEARRLWRAVERPNLMIKVPATPAGLPALTTLTAEGIHVNVTLMFSLDHYEAVARAYLDGLARLDDEALGHSASVASFFVSRVDSQVDARLEELGTPTAEELRGTIAIANARLAYQRFREIFHGEDFADFRRRGAPVQRVLYGSTSTKNPDFRDVLYVEELVGPNTVNTLPPKTLAAFRDHGEVAETVTRGWDEARARLEALGELGIDLEGITEELQAAGVAAFARSFDELLESVEAARRRLLG